MDKNSIIGLVVIAGILIVYGIFSTPSKEELDKAQKQKDSIEQVQKEQAIELEKTKAETINATPILTQTDSVVNDSVKAARLNDQFGSFSNAAQGEEKYYTIENDLIKLTIASKGGKIYSAELKKFKRYNATPLILFDGDSTIFGLNFFAQNRSIETNNLFFNPKNNGADIVVDKNADSLTMQLKVSDNKYIEYCYTLHPNSYKVDFNIHFNDMNDVITDNSGYITLNWESYIPCQEKGKNFENNYTTIYYKFLDDDVDYLSEMSSSEESLPTKVKWIAFKQQFFSSVLIAKNSFQNAFIKTTKINDNSNFLAHFKSDISLPFENKADYSFPMNFYFGPNHYNTLSSQGDDLELERLIPLGWSFFLMQWINRFAVIPVFYFLEKFISNYGIIILILTILLKVVLFPLTYKSYLSTAKMRVLKPQIDEINARIPKEKTMERQQATMELYRKVGVSPLGGCLPMLLQFPILIALFRFFPASIELRQKSFLWADDLSSYDSIMQLPFNIPFYGDHVSLFTLLMTASTLVYTYVQNKMNPTQTQMPGMKFMMYFFPLMFLFWFNSYAAGLSYYYFLANVITFGQMALIRHFVDDKKILMQLQENKKKPSKKSSFQERLEKMARNRRDQMNKR